MTEDKLQSLFFRKVNNMPQFRNCIWATPNGLWLRNKIEASKAVATGMKSGVWDLTVFKSGMIFFIETKVGTNRLTKEQIKFKEKMIEEGVPDSHFFVYRTIEDGDEVIDKIQKLMISATK